MNTAVIWVKFSALEWAMGIDRLCCTMKLRVVRPQPQTDLWRAHGEWCAEMGEAIEQSGAYL